MQLPAYVVMVTAVEPDESILELDFDDYLTKPVTREDIVGAVERMLDRQRHDEHLRELFQVVTKLATLEAKLEGDHRHESEAYRHLEARLDALWEELSDDIAGSDYRSGTIERLESALSELDAAQ